MKIENLIKTNTESIKAHTIEQREINESNVSEVIKQNTTSAMAHTTQERQVIDRHISNEHEATREHTSKESDNVKNHISTLITDVSTSRLSEAQRTKLMDSLDFNSRNERLNSVTEAHSESFHWLFGNSRKEDDSNEDGETKSEYGVEELDDSGEGMENTDDDKDIKDWILEDLIDETKRHTQDSFSAWLRSDGKLYWVAGKAGAGKTTLMKFLYSNSKTKLLLDSRVHGESLILCYFFYLMGNKMQHSIKGLLSTLLYQILEQNINGDLTANLLGLFPALQNKKSEKDWSQLDLRNVLLEALQQVSVTRPVFILVDGLDEIRPIYDAHRLPEIFNEFCRQNVKLCISSREEQVLRWHLAHSHTFNSTTSRHPICIDLLLIVLNRPQATFLATYRLLGNGTPEGASCSAHEKVRSSPKLLSRNPRGYFYGFILPLVALSKPSVTWTLGRSFRKDLRRCQVS